MHQIQVMTALTAMISVRATTLINANPKHRDELLAKMEEGFRSMDQCSYKISKTGETLEGKTLLWPMMNRFCEIWENSKTGTVSPEDLESK